MAGSSSSSSVPPANLVCIPRGQLQECIDHLHRAETAARTCSRISQQAANSYSEEANALASCRTFVEALLLRHG